MNQETADKPQIAKVSFFERTSSRKAESLLDIWASVLHARRAKTAGVPTLEVIFEEPEANMPAYLDPVSLLRVVDEKWYRPTTTDRPLAPAMVTYLAVEIILQEMRLEALRPALSILYPRTGPYQQTGYVGSHGSAHDEELGKAIRRSAVSAIAFKWKGSLSDQTNIF